MSEVRFIAEQLDKLMTKTGKSDQEVADAVGVARTTLYYWRHGRDGEYVPVPSDKLAKLADYFKVSTHYFLDKSADQSLVQKKMSALVADIADVAESLPPSKQREFREIGRAIIAAEKNKDIDSLYDELMSLIAQMAELDGGNQALKSLVREIETLASRPSTPPVKRSSRQGRTTPTSSESPQKPTEGE